VTITDKQIDVIAYRLQNGMDIHEALVILPNTEPLCKNCRFWSPWPDKKDADCLKFYQGWGEEADYERGDMARASYDDSIIHTGPKFGCIHFEVKNGEEN